MADAGAGLTSHQRPSGSMEREGGSMALFERLALLPFIAVSLSAQGSPQLKPGPTLRSSLLEQLRTTHDRKDWFVPANLAVEGLTAKQASWTDGSGNHS